jgi:hypothetical protein
VAASTSCSRSTIGVGAADQRCERPLQLFDPRCNAGARGRSECVEQELARARAQPQARRARRRTETAAASGDARAPGGGGGTDAAQVLADHHMHVDLVKSTPKKVLIVVANPAVSTTLGWPVGF